MYREIEGILQPTIIGRSSDGNGDDTYWEASPITADS